MTELAAVEIGAESSTAQLGQAITLLYRQINIANHRLLKMIAEFDARGGWKCGGSVRSCAHWLAARCGIELGAAREKVRVARRLCGLPEVEGAFAAGDMSYSKVRAITRVATAENEGFLVGLADRHSANFLEKLVSRYEPVADVEMPEEVNLQEIAPEGHAPGETKEDPELARERSREMFWFQDENGMWVIHAKLPPEQGQLVVKALEAVARPIEEERREDFQRARAEKLKAAAAALARLHSGCFDIRTKKVSAEFSVCDRAEFQFLRCEN